jgi:hypothetical protein
LEKEGKKEINKKKEIERNQTKNRKRKLSYGAKLIYRISRL